MPRLESTTSGWIALVLLSVGLAAPARAQAPVVIQEPVTISEPAPRAPLGVQHGYENRSDFSSGRVQQAKSPQTSSTCSWFNMLQPLTRVPRTSCDAIR